MGLKLTIDDKLSSIVVAVWTSLGIEKVLRVFQELLTADNN